MRREKACIGRRRDPGLRDDFSSANCAITRVPSAADFFVGKLDGGKSRRSGFDIGRERSGKVKQDFLEQFFLGNSPCFHRQLKTARQTLARRHSASHTGLFGRCVELDDHRFFFLIVD